MILYYFCMRASPDFARTASLSLTDKGELMSETENQALTFAKRLKADTTAVHDSVDNLVMSVQPFVSKENYIKFLKLQSVFHKAVDHIYKDPELNKAISELEYMARYDAVTQDLKDLGEEPYKFRQRIATRNRQQSRRLALLRRRIQFGRGIFVQTRAKAGLHRRTRRAPPRSASGRARQTLARLRRAPECPELNSGSRSRSHSRRAGSVCFL